MPTISFPRSSTGRVAALSLIAIPIGGLAAPSARALGTRFGVVPAVRLANEHRAVPRGVDDATADERPASGAMAVPRRGRRRAGGERDRAVGADRPWARDPRGDGGRRRAAERDRAADGGREA